MFLKRFLVPAAAFARPTEYTEGPSLSGASAMQNIQPCCQKCSTPMLNRDLSSTCIPSEVLMNTKVRDSSMGLFICLLGTNALGMWVSSTLRGQIRGDRACGGLIVATLCVCVCHRRRRLRHGSGKLRCWFMLIHVRKTWCTLWCPPHPKINTNVQLNQQNDAQLSNASMKSQKKIQHKWDASGGKTN